MAPARPARARQHHREQSSQSTTQTPTTPNSPSQASTLLVTFPPDQDGHRQRQTAPARPARARQHHLGFVCVRLEKSARPSQTSTSTAAPPRTIQPKRYPNTDNAQQPHAGPARCWSRSHPTRTGTDNAEQPQPGQHEHDSTTENNPAKALPKHRQRPAAPAGPARARQHRREQSSQSAVQALSTPSGPSRAGTSTAAPPRTIQSKRCPGAVQAERPQPGRHEHDSTAENNPAKALPKHRQRPAAPAGLARVRHRRRERSSQSATQALSTPSGPSRAGTSTAAPPRAIQSKRCPGAVQAERLHDRRFLTSRDLEHPYEICPCELTATRSADGVTVQAAVRPAIPGRGLLQENSLI